VLRHIWGCRKYDLMSQSRMEVYCNLDELQAPEPGWWLILTDILTQGQSQRLDVFIHDRFMPGQNRRFLVELMCPWDTDARKAEGRKTLSHAYLRNTLRNQRWDCSLIGLSLKFVVKFSG
jgi:hypothetical protein